MLAFDFGSENRVHLRRENSINDPKCRLESRSFIWQRLAIKLMAPHSKKNVVSALAVHVSAPIPTATRTTSASTKKKGMTQKSRKKQNKLSKTNTKKRAVLHGQLAEHNGRLLPKNALFGGGEQHAARSDA